MNSVALKAKCVLLDIEGTVSDVRFVYDVMFPYAKSGLVPFLTAHWGNCEVTSAIDRVAKDAGIATVEDWLGANWQADRVRSIDVLDAHLQGLMAGDSKANGLKQLQGMIWKTGFECGDLRAELFPDVLPALQKWKRSGIDIRIYSSGSVLAQKLFFGHTTVGDLSSLFSANYDTNTGPKKESASYRRIVEDSQCAAPDIVFITDVYSEIQAATQAGMQVVASVRPNNVPLPAEFTGLAITSFSQLEIAT
jgi:enolase-phosphatase E1